MANVERPLGRPESSPEQTATALAGPDGLGRSLVISEGGSIPEPWSQADQIEVDAEAPAALVERLHQAWRARERLVMVWLDGPGQANQTEPRPFHQLDVSHEPPGERLDFVLTANAIDLRGPTPRFDPLDRALAVLADAIPIPSLAGPIRADLRLADGTELLVDGGPLDLDLQQRLTEEARERGGTDAGPVIPPIVPRVHLMAGVVRPLRVRSKPTADLAPDQVQAVGHRSGPARILAPAGSGKTRVLTERARHLVADCDLAARTVCMVAYNRRAKDEMGTRLSDVPALEIRTLNSLALALATGRGPFGASRQSSQPPTTIDEFEARRLLDRILPGRRRQRLTDPLEPWIDALSACRLGLRDPAEVEQSYGGDVAGFADVLETYRQELKRRNLLDFDEQIIRAIQRLLDDPEARWVARSVVPLLMIDEFQDLTPAHLLLLRVLAGPAGEVFAVGDDDQTIYGYAGASPTWLIEFDRFFPGAVDHRLTINYRCPPEVVAGAVNLLSHNRHRVTKDISPAADDRADTPANEPRSGLDILAGDPQTSLVDWVRPLVESGVQPREIAVLARVNAALLPAALHLNAVGIPVIRPPGLGPEVLERSGVSAALAWLRLASGPAKGLRSDDLRLALRRPPRSLHPRINDWVCEQGSVGHLRSLAGRLNREKEAESVAGFADDIERLRADVEAGHDTATLLTTVYDVIGLAGAASQLDRSQRSARRAAHADELNALAAVASLQPDPSEFADWLRDQLTELPQHQVGAEAVTLATIHTTKGLEWPYVVVHDVRNDLYPHSLATDIEEERRIFHVGVTRGRRAVAITCSGPPSPFVDELREGRPADEPWPEESGPPSGDRGSSNRRETAPVKPKRAEPTGPREAALRDTLTSWRRERSKADGVPAYVVFDNKTLDAIARTQPSSLIELGAISGIGPAKLERYGADVLGLVASSQPD